MGLVYATIELTNMFDEYLHEEGSLSQTDIHRWSGEMMVDTGPIRMAINEEIKQKLGLKHTRPMRFTSADGSSRVVELTSGIKVRFGDRTTVTDAFVLPGNAEPLLGAIPIEGMDLVVIPSAEKLEYNPAHPDGPVFSLK